MATAMAELAPIWPGLARSGWRGAQRYLTYGHGTCEMNTDGRNRVTKPGQQRRHGPHACWKECSSPAVKGSVNGPLKTANHMRH